MELMTPRKVCRRCARSKNVSIGLSISQPSCKSVLLCAENTLVIKAFSIQFMSDPTETTRLLDQSHHIATSHSSQKRGAETHESTSGQRRPQLSSSQSALQNAHPCRSLSFMNPTRATVRFNDRNGRSDEKGYLEWRARDNRKGKDDLQHSQQTKLILISLLQDDTP